MSDDGTALHHHRTIFDGWRSIAISLYMTLTGYAVLVGVPVISTNVGGTPEIIRHGQTGLLVEPDDADALAAAIERLDHDSALARQLGQAGRAYVRQNLTWDRVAEAFEALYQQLPALAHP